MSSSSASVDGTGSRSYSFSGSLLSFRLVSVEFLGASVNVHVGLWSVEASTCLCKIVSIMHESSILRVNIFLLFEF